MGFKEELNGFSHAKIFLDYPLKKLCSLGVGGNVKYFATVNTLYGLKELLELCSKYKKKYKVIGNGTNLLFSDKGFNGVIISIKPLNDVFFKRNEVKVMAGASIKKLLDFNLINNLGGVECLSSIPATIGGLITMNASAFGKSISDYLTTVETIKDGKLKIYNKEDCGFKYRQSRFLNKREVIVSATFCFPKLNGEIINMRVKNYSEFRRNIQPTGRTCGSVFKNPKGYYAGELIEKANLKGFRIGGAVVSDLHANFIIADQTATASDVYLLINKIKFEIKKQFGIILKEEVELIGEF